jgi:hypothetical protein
MFVLGFFGDFLCLRVGMHLQPKLLQVIRVWVLFH